MKIKNKYMRRLLLWLALSVISLLLYGLIGHRYARQMLFLSFCLCLLLALHSFYRLIRKKIYRAVSEAYEKARQAFFRLHTHIREKLRLPAKNILLKGEDEILKAPKTKMRILHRIQSRKAARKRYRALDGNNMKIRYLYAKFVTGKIKRGYRFSPSKTPRQIALDFRDDPKAELLFPVYETVRYSASPSPVSDSIVKCLADQSKTDSSFETGAQSLDR